MKKNSWYILISVLVVDLFSKYLVLSKVIKAEVIKNPGLPFVGKFFPGFFDVAVVLTGLIVFFVLYKKLFGGESESAFALIVGGAVANLVDRVIDGGVTDFIDIGLGGKFNIADVAIWVGIAIMVYSVFYKARNQTSIDES